MLLKLLLLVLAQAIKLKQVRSCNVKSKVFDKKKKLTKQGLEHLRVGCNICDMMTEKRDPDEQNVRVALACYFLRQRRCCDVFSGQKVLF